MPKPAEDLKNLDIHALGRYIKEHIDLKSVFMTEIMKRGAK